MIRSPVMHVLATILDKDWSSTRETKNANTKQGIEVIYDDHNFLYYRILITLTSRVEPHRC